MLAPLVGGLTNSLLAMTKKAIEPMLEEKLNIMFIYNPEKVKPYGTKPSSQGSSAASKAQAACDKVRLILSSLVDETKPGCFDKEVLESVAKMTMERWFMQQSFHFESEINRMQFSAFGSIKNQLPNRVKMMCVCLLIFQILIPKILKCPWKHYQSVKQPPDPSLRLNLRIINSILYWICFDWIKQNVPMHPNGQMHLAVNMKTKPIPAKTNLDDEIPVVPRKLKPNEEALLIENVFDKEQDMPALYNENKQLILPLRSLIEGWADKIGKMVMETQEGIRLEMKMKAQEQRNKRKQEVIEHLTKNNWERFLEPPQNQ